MKKETYRMLANGELHSLLGQFTPTEARRYAENYANQNRVSVTMLKVECHMPFVEYHKTAGENEQN